MQNTVKHLVQRKEHAPFDPSPTAQDDTLVNLITYFVNTAFVIRPFA